jgi:hypothetical protein
MSEEVAQNPGIRSAAIAADPGISTAFIVGDAGKQKIMGLIMGLQTR